jgi:hypothetical protein
VSVNDAVPVKPFNGPIVIVDVVDVPTGAAAGEVAAIVKSLTVNVAVVE